MQILLISPKDLCIIKMKWKHYSFSEYIFLNSMLQEKCTVTEIFSIGQRVAEETMLPSVFEKEYDEK